MGSRCTGQCPRLRIPGLGIRAPELPRFGLGVRGLGFGVWGLGFGGWGLRFGAWGLGFRSLGVGVGGLGSRFTVYGLRSSGRGRHPRRRASFDCKLRLSGPRPQGDFSPSGRHAKPPTCADWHSNNHAAGLGTQESTHELSQTHES